jgi:hypothetical protein
VLAPGDGEAEPGVMVQFLTEPAKQATDVIGGFVISQGHFLRFSCVAHFVGWDVFGFGSPGSASPSPGAITLHACFAGSLELFVNLNSFLA